MATYLVHTVDVYSETIDKTVHTFDAVDAYDALIQYFTSDGDDADAYDWVDEQLPLSKRGAVSYCGNDDFRFIIVRIGENNT